MPARLAHHLKVLRGTDRPDREPREPVLPRKGHAKPPTWLPVAERAAFRQLAGEVEETGIPSASFTHVLAGAAVAWIQVRRATKVLTEKGDAYESTTTTGALKILPRPEVGQRNAALRLLKMYLVELGLTPVGIGRVDRAALPKPAPKDLGSEYFHD